MPIVVAAVLGYAYGAFVEDDGVTVGKVALVGLVGGAIYYMVKKAGK